MNNLPQVKSKKGKVYTVTRTLGQGQYGKVYLVVDEQGVQYAMKSVAYEHFRMDAKKIQNLVTEQNIMEIANSPRILKLYDKIDDGRIIHLITTYCDGGNLEELILKNKKGLGEAKARKFLIQIGEAFHEMRRNRIIHRDLKLANIFLNKGDIVIGDFGFAKLGVSMTGSKLGTPYYMAPEILNQSSNSSKYTSKCDLWSIGVCYYFLLFGMLPFDANSLAELKSKIEKNSGEKLPFPKTEPISIESKRLLVGLLQKYPDQRWSFDQFFEFCGLKPIAEVDVRTGGSYQDLETITETNELSQRQLSNFGGQSQFSLESLNPSAPTKSNEMSLQDKSYQHNATPINSSQNLQQKGEKFSISKMNESLAEEESYGYICFRVNQNLPEANPYIFRINQVVFFFNVLKKIKDSRIPSNANIRKSDFNSLFILVEVLTARKTEVFIQEIKKVVIGRVNVFKIPTFNFFCSTKLYSDIWQVIFEFEDFIGGIFEVLQVEIDKDAPKYKSDLAKIRAMDTNQIVGHIRDQCTLIWKNYLKYANLLTPAERSCILHIIVYLIYFCQDNLFPVEKFSSHKDWTKFNSFIDGRTDGEIEKEMALVFNQK